MTLIPLACPLCEGVFQVESAHAGSEVACPHCAKAVRLPDELTPAASDAPPVPPVPATPAHDDAKSSGEASQAAHRFPVPPTATGDPSVSDAPPPPVSFVGAAPPAPISNEATPEAPPVSRSPPPIPESTASDPDKHLPRLTCATCEHLFRVPLDTAGGQVFCPSCNAIVDVPNVLVEAVEVPDYDAVVAPEFQFEDVDETADGETFSDGIRHLSREERSKVRARRNLIMLVTGFLLLFGSIFILQHYQEFFMDLWERSGFAPVEQEQEP
jgi:DNA-directed RNA polymerase subunit RPC12/RpoP